MATFYSWNGSERGEKDYIEHVGEHKPSRFDRIVAALSFGMLLLLLLFSAHFERQTPAGHGLNDGSVSPQTTETVPSDRCMQESPYGMPC